jgi:hypothetical protein
LNNQFSAKQSEIKQRNKKYDPFKGKKWTAIVPEESQMLGLL